AKDGLTAVLAADPTISPATRAALVQVQSGLTRLTGASGGLIAGADGAASLQRGVTASATGAAKLASGGAALRRGTSSLAGGLHPLAAGLRSSAAGASSLASGAAGLSSGADGVATGARKIAAGIRSSASGARSLATGATSLGAGLATASKRLPAADESQASRIGDVLADPVEATSVRRHETTSIGEIVSALIVPVALWIGAEAALLLFGAFRRRLLATGIGTGRLVGTVLARGSALAALQSVLLVALLLFAFGLPAASALLVLLIAVVAGVAFFALHQLLGAVFGRAGTVVSIVLLCLQLVAVGGLYPIELVSAPFQVVSPYLPLTAAVHALQAVITGSGPAAVGSGIAVLAIQGLLAFALTVALVARRRTSVALFAAPLAPSLG
ncbi:MAG: putative rane protein, partial [Microbacteriaceae bacterium]|nr:putative rane protein [Microbacteriaceae bacterium]